MAEISTGLVMWRLHHQVLEFFLVHPGGPFYVKKNEGVWSIPKGVPEKGEDLLAAAQREFFEETGIQPQPPFQELGHIRQKSGKIVHAWSFRGEWDPASGIISNTFELEWPPRSGKRIAVPEIDRAEWMTLEAAVKMINPAQVPLLEQVKSNVR